MSAQTVRVGQILHGKRVFWQAREALQVHSSAERDNQLVVMQVDRNALHALDDDHLLLGKVDPHNFRLPHLNLAQQLTKRHDCICGMDGRCGYFGEQGLEDEVVVGSSTA